MPGTYQYDVEIKSNVAKLLSDMKQVQDRLDAVEGKEYKIKLNVDKKKLSNVISNLEKMLDSLGKGTGDFKQLESLSKELSSIATEVQSLSKAFGKVDDSGAKTLLSSIQNIDKSLSDLSQNILNVNKNMSNMGGNTSGAVRQVENIGNAAADAVKQVDKLADAQSKLDRNTNVLNGLDSNISKYQEIVSLVKEYYELTSKLKQPTLKWQSKPEDYKRIDAYLATAPAVKGSTFTKDEIEKNINSTYHQMAKGINEGKDFAVKAMKSAIQNYWGNITQMPSDNELLSSRKIDRSYKGKSSEEYIIPKKYQELEKSVLQETIAMNQNNAAYEEEQKQIKANNAAIEERLKLIRQSIKQNGVSSDYNGDYKMGLSLKASDKDKKDVFKMTSDLSQEEMLKEICNMLGVKIPQNADKAKQAIKEVSSATSETNISSGLKDAFPKTSENLEQIQANNNLATANENVQKAVEGATSVIKENAQVIDNGELPSIDELIKKANEAAYALTKGKDIVSQTGKKQVYKTTEITDDGKTAERMVGSFSYVERTQAGQLKSIQATFDETTQKWREETTSLVTYFNQVEKAIISADNKINSLENDRNKTLAAHPEYDTSADDALIESEKNHRAELQKTLDTYVTEKEYVYQIEAAEKRIAENQQRLQNVSAKQENRRKVVSEEHYNAETAKQLAKEFNNAWDEANKINSALDETKNTIASLSQMKELSSQFNDMNIKVASLNSELVTGKITVSDYKKEVKSLTSEYSKIVGVQQKRDVEEYNTNNAKQEAYKIEQIKAAYNELTIAISQYKEVASRIASNKALDGDEEKMDELLVKIEQLQNTPILQNTKELDNANAKLEKIENNLDVIQEKAKQTAFNGFDKRISSYEGKLTNYQATAKKFEGGGWTSDTYKEQIEKLNNAIREYKSLLSSMQNDSGLVTDDNIQRLNEYESEIKEVISTVSNMSAAEKGFSFLSAQKELDKINNILKEHSGMSREAKNQIKAYYAQIKSGNPSASLDVIHAKIMEIVNAEVEAGRGGKSMFDAIKEKAWYGVASAIGTYFGFNDILRYGREAIDTIVELDDALVDLKKTTSMSSSELENFYYDANDVAKQMGVTTKEIIDQASSWSRLGYNTKEASTEMAQLSSQFASISPGMDTDTAQEG